MKKTERGDTRILLVEDSPTQTLELQTLLEDAGFRVFVAGNGVEALKAMDRQIPGLVISDIVMPRMDGYELCRRIKDNDEMRHIPVMLLSHLSEAEDIIQGLECGADNFVTKPFDPQVLLSQIDYILVNRVIRQGSESGLGIEVFFAGKRHHIDPDRIQILDLLFSVYEDALRKKRQLEETNRQLKEALETIKTLQGLLPICANCKKIRDDQGKWQRIESYIQTHSDAEFTHSICPECIKALYPDL